MHVSFNSNMGTSGLPDMYTQCLRAADRRVEGLNIMQAMSACVATVM